MRRAILVGADERARDELRAQLGLVDQLEVIAEASQFEAILSSLQTDRPDFLFFLPDGFPGNGLKWCGSIRQQFPTTKLVIVTTRSDIELVLGYAQIEVAAYVHGDHLATLVQDLTAVARGEVILDRSIQRAIVELFRTSLGLLIWQAAQALPIRNLDREFGAGDVGRGPRRLEVLRLYRQGLTYKEIARRLCVKESTVAEHLKRERARRRSLPIEISQ